MAYSESDQKFFRSKPPYEHEWCKDERPSPASDAVRTSKVTFGQTTFFIENAVFPHTCMDCWLRGHHFACEPSELSLEQGKPPPEVPSWEGRLMYAPYLQEPSIADKSLAMEYVMQLEKAMNHRLPVEMPLNPKIVEAIRGGSDDGVDDIEVELEQLGKLVFPDESGPRGPPSGATHHGYTASWRDFFPGLGEAQSRKLLGALFSMGGLGLIASVVGAPTDAPACSRGVHLSYEGRTPTYFALQLQCVVDDEGDRRHDLVVCYPDGAGTNTQDVVYNRRQGGCPAERCADGP